MQIYAASQLAESELPEFTFTLPQGLQGAIVQNVSAWWLQINRNGTNFTIPPWSIATYPIASAEGWTVSGISFEPGDLTVSQNYVEVDYSTGPVQLSLVPMSELPIYESTIAGDVTVIGGEITVPDGVAVTGGEITVPDGVGVTGGQAGAGTSVYVATPPKNVGTLTIPAGQLYGEVVLTPDANATGIGALINVPAAQAPTTLLIFGASGYVYAEASAQAGIQISDLLQSVIFGNIEQITISAHVAVAPGSDLTVGFVFETYGAQSSTPVNGPYQPLFVQGSGINPIPIPVTGSGAGVDDYALQTLEEAPEYGVAIPAIFVAASGSVTLIAAPPVGESIRIRYFTLFFYTTGVATGVFEDASATKQFGAWISQVTNTIQIDGKGGFALPPHEAFIMKNNSATASGFFVASILYDVY